MVQCLNYTLDTQTYSTVVAYTHSKVKALMEIQTNLFCRLPSAEIVTANSNIPIICFMNIVLSHQIFQFAHHKLSEEI